MISLEDWEKLFLKKINQHDFNDPSHDLEHINRVIKNAKTIQAHEGGNLWVIIPAAYLHDIYNPPKDSPDRKIASKVAAEKGLALLKHHNYPDQYFPEIAHAIEAHSFSAHTLPTSLEAKIVQDADRLDAIGAIGIMRCLSVGTQMGASFYDPSNPIPTDRVLKDKKYSIDHFYQKLLLLADKMNTSKAKAMAHKRHQFLKEFLLQLEEEIT